MSHQVEKISSIRLKIIAAIAIIYSISQFFSLSLVSHWLGFSDNTQRTIIDAGSFLFLLAFAGVLFFTQHASSKLKKGERAALYDDLTRYNELKAVELGCIMMAGLSALLMFLTSSAINDAFNGFIQFTPSDVARIIFTSGLTTVAFRFIYLETRSA